MDASGLTLRDSKHPLNKVCPIVQWPLVFSWASMLRLFAVSHYFSSCSLILATPKPHKIEVRKASNMDVDLAEVAKSGPGTHNRAEENTPNRHVKVHTE